MTLRLALVAGAAAEQQPGLPLQWLWAVEISRRCLCPRPFVETLQGVMGRASMRAREGRCPAQPRGEWRWHRRRRLIAGLFLVVAGWLSAAASAGAQAGSYTLSVSWSAAYSAAGTVSSTPAGIDCAYPGFDLASCFATFPQGTAVTLTETRTDGAPFLGWSGGGCTGTDPCTVIMTADTTITASAQAPPPPAVAPPPPRPMTVSVSLAGTGAGTVSGPGIACPGTCSASYAQPQMATLTATPAVGSKFAGWSGACTGTSACTLPLAVTDQVTATFDPPAGRQRRRPRSRRPCVVPNLRHVTLRAARTMLARRHCALGKVTPPAHRDRRSVLYVVKQSVRPATHKRHGYRIAVTLAPRAANHATP